MKLKYALLTALMLTGLTSHAETISLGVKININDVYTRRSSILLEGESRTASGELTISSSEGVGSVAIDPTSTVLDSTMLIVKSTNSVTFLDQGSETYKAQMVFLPNGDVKSLSILDNESDKALKDDLEQARLDLITLLENSGIQSVKVDANISTYDCESTADEKINCKAIFSFVIEAEKIEAEKK